LLLRSSGPELLQQLAEIEAKPELTPGALCARHALAAYHAATQRSAGFQKKWPQNTDGIAA
jgi:hypothetical protein